MCAVIVGYNGFFVPEAEPVTIIQSEQTNNENSLTSDDEISTSKVLSDSNASNNANDDKVIDKNSEEKSKSVLSNNVSDENRTSKYKSNLVNINTATESELSDNLKGIGNVMAKRIVEYRDKNGGFSSIEEIKNVKGIGEKLFDKIKDYITVK